MQNPQRIYRWLLCLLSCLLIAPAVYSLDIKYRDQASLTRTLRQMQRQSSRQIQLSTLARSNEDHPVWLATIGNAQDKDKHDNPAILIVAGLEGNDLGGTEAALQIIESLGNQARETELLSDSVVYVIPRLNPDAAEAYFQSPRYERITDLTPFDEDHDGLVDEDGPGDINDDGMISWMRVEDEEGSWIAHPNDPRVTIEADATKGETGRWLYVREGKDEDGDEEVNEDAVGGVDFNQNFPYDYPWFAPHAGKNPVFQPETRALAEFVSKQKNIAVVLTFAGNSNLLKTPESGDRSSGREPQTKIRNEDVKYYEYFGSQWRESMHIEEEISTDSIPGSFVDWMYFHKGKFSFSAPLWSMDIALAMKKDEAKAEEGESSNVEKENENPSKKEESNEGEEEDSPGKTERDFLKWIEENAPDRFIPWQSIEHPDYPGKAVEVGGFAPYAKTLPPENDLVAIANAIIPFVTGTIERLPHVEFGDVRIENPGKDVWDIRIEVKNSGYLPTVSAHGERTGEINPTRVTLEIEKASLLAGRLRTMLGPIAGGESKELHYVIRGKKGSKIPIEAISALAGSDTLELTLKEVRP